MFGGGGQLRGRGEALPQIDRPPDIAEWLVESLFASSKTQLKTKKIFFNFSSPALMDWAFYYVNAGNTGTYSLQITEMLEKSKQIVTTGKEGTDWTNLSSRENTSLTRRRNSPSSFPKATARAPPIVGDVSNKLNLRLNRQIDISETGDEFVRDLE